MILIDSNIPMYLVGEAHPHKSDAQRLLESAITSRSRLVTDAEVLQEICHRYSAINRLDAVQPAFDSILGAVDEVLAVTRADVEAAKEILMGVQGISARDSLHVAIMRRHSIDKIMSFDRGLDLCPGVERLS